MKPNQVYQEALNELHIAQHQFDNADSDHVDIAVHQLHAAELKVDVAIRAVKAG